MHTFDLLAYIQKEELDVYGRMKFLNFVRKQTFNNPEYRNRSRNSNSTSGVAKEGEDSSSKTSTPQSASSVVVPERTQWDMDDNLVPMFGNDHFPWMLESFLEGKQSTGEGALDGLLGAVRKSKSVENGELDKEQKEVVVKACLEDSKNNTIEGVVAEDFPQLTESCLTDQEMYKSLR
uniref:Uncharacterized protein n=1 Tax=Ditylenchus dipsaci TaxID=166011 RepID=A0A915CWX8_9BILA